MLSHLASSSAASDDSAGIDPDIAVAARVADVVCNAVAADAAVVAVAADVAVAVVAAIAVVIVEAIDDVAIVLVERRLSSFAFLDLVRIATPPFVVNVPSYHALSTDLSENLLRGARWPFFFVPFL